MILAVVGMKREARLLARLGLHAIVGGGDSARLAAGMEALLASPLIPANAGTQTRVSPAAADAKQTSLDPRMRWDERDQGWTGVLSFGVAGGLDPELQPGDLVIGRSVWGVDALPSSWAEQLAAALPDARLGLIAGQDFPAVSVADKAALFAATGALAVDMESRLAAEAAAGCGLPFAAVRAISDPADHSLPRAAIAGFGGDGGVDVGAVLLALARDPRQLPALIRTGRDAERAMRSLRAAAESLA